MKGVVALQRGLLQERTRLLKLQGSGRLGLTDESCALVNSLRKCLENAAELAHQLRQYEIATTIVEDIDADNPA
jgi:hypothetical protein